MYKTTGHVNKYLAFPEDDVRVRSQAPSRLFRLAEGALLRSW
jgi:hypothetical protein